jgi:hypothetical protein
MGLESVKKSTNVMLNPFALSLRTALSAVKGLNSVKHPGIY